MMWWVVRLIMVFLLLGLMLPPQQVRAGCDKNYQPTKRGNPEYPRRARSRGIEGFVILEFTVTRSGAVEDITVVDAAPKRIFDRAAIRAAQDFVFEPCVVGGEIFEIRNFPLKFSFGLSEAGL